VIFSEPPLSGEAKDEVAEDGGVDSDEEPAHVPENDGQVDITEESDLGVAVDDPEGEGDEEACEVGERNPLVSSTDGKHVTCDTPGNGKGVVLLDVLTRPDVGALDGGQDSKLVVNNALHHDVVEDCANNAAEYLSREGALRR